MYPKQYGGYQGMSGTDEFARCFLDGLAIDTNTEAFWKLKLEARDALKAKSRAAAIRALLSGNPDDCYWQRN